MQDDLPSYQLFQQVFYQYYKPLCQYAFTLIKIQHVCEDIVQEIFMRIWEKRQDLLDKNEIRFYLFTAVRNNCFTFLEKKKKSIFLELSGRESANDPADSASELSTEPDLSGLLAEALDRLPPKCREVFVLSRMSKLTYQQIAETSGISVKTVENQMGKALALMRSFIKEKRMSVIHLLLFLSFITATQ